MDKCKHKNSVVYELYRDYEEWSYWIDGEYAHTESSTGMVRSGVRFECTDCGVAKRYPESRVPKWIEERLTFAAHNLR